MIDPPQGSDAASLADWAELWLFAGGGEVLTRLQIKRTLQHEPDDDPRDDDDDPAGAEIEVAHLESMVREDTRADRLLAEIARRAAAAPRIYRVRAEDGVISQTDVPGDSIYEFLHWISLPEAPFRGEREDEVEQPFDELAMAALKVLVGPAADGVLFARRYAVDPATDALRPTSFPDAIRWLRGRLKLPAGLEVVPQGPPADDEGDHPARTYSDGGVDVIVWRHFADGRAGFAVVLAQCTIQFKWRPKTTDVVLDLWGDWIRFVTPPHKALVVPFAVPERSWWRDRTRTAGMILDRMRVCELLDSITDDELQALTAAQMSEWLTKEREAFVASLAA